MKNDYIFLNLVAAFVEFNIVNYEFLVQRCFKHQQNVLLTTIFFKSSLDVELTVPPRFALASAMSSSGITTELVTYMLAKRSAELDRLR